MKSISKSGNYLLIFALAILSINLISIYHFRIGLESDWIIVKSLGYTSAGWKAIHGEKAIESKLIESGYDLDSISVCEFSLTGQTIDSQDVYFPYDPFKIKFEINGVVESINCDKKYCPVLNVTNWKWVNKYLELLNYISAFLVSILLIGFGVHKLLR